MALLLASAGLLISFYLLAKICEDYFVESLEIIAGKLKLSQDVAGATLMAIGSSAPELFTSIVALTKVGSENVGAGTIVGSAIFNVLVIVGVSAAVATAYLSWRPVLRDLLFYIISILLLLFTFSDGHITLGEAALYLMFYALYIGILSQWSRWYPDRPLANIEPLRKTDRKREVRQLSPILMGVSETADALVGLAMPSLRQRPNAYMRVFFTSILLIGALSWVLVELAIVLAHSMGISEVVIALTILAGGTSVPDMLSSMIVARQGKGGMAVSNAVGSNTFDILIGLGLPWLGYILITGKEVSVSTENLVSSIFLLFFTVIALLFLLSIQKFRIGRKSGYFLLLFYAIYLFYALFAAYHPEVLVLEAWLNGAGEALLPHV